MEKNPIIQFAKDMIDIRDNVTSRHLADFPKQARERIDKLIHLVYISSSRMAKHLNSVTMSKGKLRPSFRMSSLGWILKELMNS